LRNDGVWALPDGDQYYQHAIELNTTTRMTAEQIHELGLSEVARIKDEMTRGFDKAGYREGSLLERYRRLGDSPEQRYANSDEGRASILQDYQSLIDEISAGMDRYFGLKPTAAVVVQRVPAFPKDRARRVLQRGIDRSFAAGAILREPARRRRNEALPHAHARLPRSRARPSPANRHRAGPERTAVLPPGGAVHRVRRGLGTVRERLAWETGYQKNAPDDLGRLQDEMFRAVRLVVDTGMHAKRWSREQAIAYMMENTGMPEAEVVVEIERYLVMPAQALAYKIGMLKILELRERAKRALGARFDLREFHDEVLKNGALPLALLGAGHRRVHSAQESGLSLE
jgi:uncharacterized protein (DUF885 family)